MCIRDSCITDRSFCFNVMETSAVYCEQITFRKFKSTQVRTARSFTTSFSWISYKRYLSILRSLYCQTILSTYCTVFRMTEHRWQFKQVNEPVMGWPLAEGVSDRLIDGKFTLIWENKCHSSEKWPFIKLTVVSFAVYSLPTAWVPNI